MPVFQVYWVSSFGSPPPPLRKRTFDDYWNGSFTGQMSFLLPSRQCQSTEGNSKHWPQPVAWPHPFFIHHQTSCWLFNARSCRYIGEISENFCCLGNGPLKCSFIFVSYEETDWPRHGTHHLCHRYPCTHELDDGGGSGVVFMKISKWLAAVWS